jgi:hypothetical protein
LGGKGKKPKKKFCYYNDYGTVFPGTGNNSRRKSSSSGRREADYIEVGGGNDCEDCEGTGRCRHCKGTTLYLLNDGSPYLSCMSA